MSPPRSLAVRLGEALLAESHVALGAKTYGDPLFSRLAHLARFLGMQILHADGLCEGMEPPPHVLQEWVLCREEELFHCPPFPQGGRFPLLKSPPVPLDPSRCPCEREVPLVLH